jgi:hypothetical protein
MDRSKQAVVERLAQAHYAIEPAIQLILRLEAEPDKENDPAEPVKLLEVNPDTIPAGILPLYFPAHSESGLFYPSIIIEVTPEEYQRILEEPSTLPEGWRMGKQIDRLVTAKAG